MGRFDAWNLLAIAVQIACLVGVATAVAAVVTATTPRLRHAFWRAVLVLCVVLPWVQTPPSVTIAHVPPVSEVEQSPIPVTANAVVAASPAVDWYLVVTAIWVVGCVARAVWLLLGYRRLQQWRSAGTSFAAEHVSTQRALGTRADVRYVDAVTQPVTFGLIQPVVLLPEQLRQQPESVREAVITHELLHVRRRDWAWVVIEELVRTIVWWHPAIWWVLDRIQQTREEIVDADTVATTGRRREYLEALVSLADSSVVAPAPSFARRRSLFQRIVLLSKEEVMSFHRLSLSALVLGLVVALTSVVAVRALPLHGPAIQVRQAPGPLEQQARPITADNPVPARAYEVLPSFPSGVAPNVTVTLTLRTVVDAGGTIAEMRVRSLSFSREDIHGTVGETKLEEQAGAFDHSFASLESRTFFTRGGSVAGADLARELRTFIDAAAESVGVWRFDPPREAPVVLDTLVRFGEGGAVTTSTVAAGGIVPVANGALRVGGNIRTPRKVKDVRPVYPQEAQDARIQGVVIAEVRIEPDGKVGLAHIVRSIPALDAAALDAVRQWEFQPTLLNGVAVPIVMTVTVQFSLSQ